MKTIRPKMDHSKESLEKAMGLSFYQMNYVSTVVLFERLSSHIMVKELYDHHDEAPLELTTMTGLLELSLARLTTVPEQAYLLLMYRDLYRQINKDLDDMEKADKAKKETRNQEKKTDEKPKEENKEEAFVSAIKSIFEKVRKDMRFMPYLKAMEVLKEVNHDFQKFMDRVCPKDKMDAIEEALKNAIENKGLDLNNLDDEF
jgi:hypothetical protein